MKKFFLLKVLDQYRGRGQKKKKKILSKHLKTSKGGGGKKGKPIIKAD